MAVSFTGVNTGNSYTVGERYTTPSGREYEAQRDGSFRDVNTGATAPGSRGSSESEWSASGKDATFGAGWVENRVTGEYQYVTGRELVDSAGGAVRLAAVPSGTRVNPETGALERAPSVVTVANSRGAAVTAAVQGGGAGRLTGVLQPENTNLLLGGFELFASPRWSRAEEAETGFGELMTELVGIAGFGSAVGYTAARAVFGPDVDKMSPGQRFNELTRRGEGLALDIGEKAATDWIDGVMSWRDQFNAKQETINSGVAASMREFDDAWDRRLELQSEQDMYRTPHAEAWHGIGGRF